MTTQENPKVLPEVEDDEPDDWDKRIFSTGCASELLNILLTRAKIAECLAEQQKLNDCYFEKKDWRKCKKQMEAFRECWKRQGNDQRTETKDA